MDSVVDPVYLPFAEEQLLAHFARVKRRGKCVRNERHLDYYRNSVGRYREYLAENPERIGRPLSKTRRPCQIEKDERFWVASCMMTVFHSDRRQQQLRELLVMAYGGSPPVRGLSSWEECLGGDLGLFFEANLPSLASYREWLYKNLEWRQMVPYVLDSAHGKRRLEGSTNVDALLLNPSNGFAVVVEAKVLSDMSCQTTYDTTRNQIARNVDVMLEENRCLCEPLSRRDPGRTLFILLTPRLFKAHGSIRLYGCKFNKYKERPESMAADLPHRRGMDWWEIADRLGWLAWEDFRGGQR